MRIVNLYLEDTIEEDVYQTLKQRIGAFEEVIGPLQPILTQMPRILRRWAQGEIELVEARHQLEEAAQERPRVAMPSLETYVQPDPQTLPPEGGDSPAVTQEQLASWCLAHPAPAMRILTVPEPGTHTLAQDGTRGCLAITWADVPPHLCIDPTEEVLVTFQGELADRHPPMAPTRSEDGPEIRGKEGVRLLTWGDPYLTAWLEAVRGEPLTEGGYRSKEA